jgi:DNA-binding XRE family transcriptional regulator
LEYDDPVLFPALATEKNGEYRVVFKGLAGCEVRVARANEVWKLARETLNDWLIAELRARRVPPHPPRRIHLWKHERLLRVPPAPDVAVAILVRWARTEAGLTQAELAARMGVAQPRIAELELPGGNPSIERLQRVAQALHLRLEILFSPPLT